MIKDVAAAFVATLDFIKVRVWSNLSRTQKAVSILSLSVFLAITYNYCLKKWRNRTFFFLPKQIITPPVNRVKAEPAKLEKVDPIKTPIIPKLEFSDGIYFEGQFEGQILKQGKLIYSTTESETIEGSYTLSKEKKLSGKGKWITSKETCEGTLENGMLQGFAKKIIADGTIYEGTFKEHTLNGWGQIVAKDLTTTGFFKADKLHGFGSINTPEKIITGHFEDHIFKGFGKITNPKSNLTRIGEFDRNILQGQGKVIQEKGSIEGTFKDNELAGFGRIVTDEDVIEGEIHGMELEGFGRVAVNNSQFIGQFKKGIQHTFGYQKDSSKATYLGQVSPEGKQTGEGTKIFPSGEKHTGIFVNGQLHGLGSKSTPEGYYSIGHFENGKLVKGKIKEMVKSSALFEGVVDYGDWVQGKLTLKDSTSYTGQFKNKLFEGNGSYTMADGSTYQGLFVKGVINGPGFRHFIDQVKGLVIERGTFENGVFKKEAKPADRK